jgi:hypothetical protein
VDLVSYLDLCWRTSVLLGLEDSARLGTNLPVVVEGVRCQAIYTEGLPGILLLAEVGPVTHDDKAAVYEQLLSLQLMHWMHPDLRFGFHPVRGTVMLCMTLALGDSATSEAFAELIRSAAAQVTAWKHELLAGKVGSSAGVESEMVAMTMGAGVPFGAMGI